MRVNKAKRIDNVNYNNSIKRLEIDDNWDLTNFIKRDKDIKNT